jgi:hypothetical protein
VSRFVEESIAKAGLLPVLAAHRAGDVEAVRASLPTWSKADLLLLGAIADIARAEDSGDTVSIHENASPDVAWIQPVKGASELDVLRAVAVARISGAKTLRVGVDWSQCGLELAQVALGFGASELRGPITRKSGLPIYEDETKKVKGQGMVELKSIKKREIAALVTHAGRLPVFVDDEPRPRDGAREVNEVAHNV